MSLLPQPAVRRIPLLATPPPSGEHQLNNQIISDTTHDTVIQEPANPYSENGGIPTGQYETEPSPTLQSNQFVLEPEYADQIVTECMRLTNELDQTKAKLQMNLYGDGKVASTSSDNLTQTDELFVSSEEYTELVLKCESYEEKCTALEQKQSSLDASPLPKNLHLIANLTAQITKLKSEITKLTDELEESNAKLQMTIYDGGEVCSSSDNLTQTDELFVPTEEYTKLELKCESYEQKCSELEQKQSSLEAPTLSTNLIANMTAEIVKLRSENKKLSDEKEKLHGDQKGNDSDLQPKKRKRTCSDVRSSDFTNKRTQTKEIFVPSEKYEKLKSRCERYEKKCSDLLKHRRVMLEASGSKTDAKMKFKTDLIATMKSMCEKLKRENEALATEKNNFECKLRKIEQETFSASEKQQELMAAKQKELQQLDAENKRLSSLLSDKATEISMLRQAALAKLKEKAKTDEEMVRLSQTNKRFEKTNLKLAKEKTELTEKLEAQMERKESAQVSHANRKIEVGTQCEQIEDAKRQSLAQVHKTQQQQTCKCQEMELNVSEMVNAVYRATNQLAQLQHTNASVVTKNDLLRKKLTEKETLLNRYMSLDQNQI